VGDTAAAMAVVVMSITATAAAAAAMATAGLHLLCIPTGRVGTTRRTGILETTLPTGTTPPTGTPETTMRAGAVGGTPRHLMAGAGQEGIDRSRRIGCRREAMVVVAAVVAVAMTGKRLLPLPIPGEHRMSRCMAMAWCSACCLVVVALP
jgi:hypothetical protein